MRFLSTISLFLMLAGLSGFAQSGPDIVSNPPLNGNWNITGNRQKKQFPLLSMHIHVNGAKVIAHGDVEVRCPSDPRNGGGAKGGGLAGNIMPDGSFTLRNSSVDTTHVEIRGQVPAQGAATWNGEYTLTRAASPNCPLYQETKSFTATPLATLNGTFSVSMQMRYFEPPPPSYAGPESYQAKFTITITQGAVVSQRLNDGGFHFYLPLAGTIHVKGLSCFSHGFADSGVDSAHGSARSPYSSLRGDYAVVRFAMNDESQLTVQAVFADPNESALSVFDARVTGGKCDKQNFHGMLDAGRR
jgi:hypothetical protein